MRKNITCIPFAINSFAHADPLSNNSLSLIKINNTTYKNLSLDKIIHPMVTTVLAMVLTLSFLNAFKPFTRAALGSYNYLSTKNRKCYVLSYLFSRVL